MSDQTSQLRTLRQGLKPYESPKLSRSIIEIVLSFAPLAAIWAAAWVALAFGFWWLSVLLTIPAGAFLVRLFMVQHDCSHRAFFKSNAANDVTGGIIGLLTLTPHYCWRRSHAIHHATSGNLDRRGLGDIQTLTVAEYRALSPIKRAGYRIFRHPLVMFGIGPAYLFLIEQRAPIGFMRDGIKPWLDAAGPNIALAAFIVLTIVFGGWQGMLLIHLPTLIIAASIGVWLFFVQHQFEDTYWARNEGWNHAEAALHGSSFYDLPAPLRWMTGNIGIHHVHHVSSRIPFYRLPEVLRDRPELKNVSRLTLWRSFRMARLALWDEAKGRLVSFRAARRSEAMAGA